MNKRKKIPKFKTEREERQFWEKQDSTEYVDWAKAKSAVFPDLKPSAKTITLRLPEYLLNEIKVLANKQDVPYQALIRFFLKKQLKKESRRKND